MKATKAWEPKDKNQKLMMLRDMFDLAEGYDESASVLSAKLHPCHGPAATLLGILAFEIRLKAVNLASTGTRPASHEYKALWNALDAGLRDEILGSATQQFSGHVNYETMAQLLDNLEKAFKKGRYQYEINDNRSPEETSEAGEKWIEELEGASEKADLAFYPSEVEGLNFSLGKWLWDHLAKTRQSDP